MLAESRDYKADVRRDVPREFFVDVTEAFRAAAKQAQRAVTQSHIGVDGGVHLGTLRRHRVIGLVRFQLSDEIFEQIVAQHGGEFVGQVPVEGIDGPVARPIFLTTARFGGTLIGFASHHEPDDLPVKNASRIALAAQNAGLSRDMFYESELYVDRERFVLILVQRDHFDIGGIASMTVAMIDPTFSTLVMQSEINEFLASYGTAPKAKSGFTLRKDPGSYREQDVPAEEAKKKL